jgi:hypothetical protein
MEGRGHRAAIDPNRALALFPDDPDNDGPWEPLANCRRASRALPRLPPPGRTRTDAERASGALIPHLAIG